VKSIRRGKSVSKAEVTNISEHGFWIFVDGDEYFVAVEQFPWFEMATIKELSNVELWHGGHLYWPALDVDLSVKIIEHPERYKLVCRQ